MEEKKISLEVVNPNAAGIDIGSRSHWVAVGQNAEDVKEFGVYSQDQMDLCGWLKSKNVTSIAMESTGTYWQNLFSTLVGQVSMSFWSMAGRPKTSKAKRPTSKTASGFKNCTPLACSLPVSCPILIPIQFGLIPDTGSIF
jgi:hypothetical protein